MLKIFSEKPDTCSSPNSLTISNVSLPLSIFRSGIQEVIPTKKKEKKY